MSGLISDLIDSINIDKQNYEVILQSKETILYEEGLKITLQTLEQICSTQDVAVILDAEEAFLKQELENYQEINEHSSPSLESALIDLQSMKNCHALLQSPDQYRAACKLINIKHTVRGLPKDAFSSASNSHITRLGNRLHEVPLPPMETQILRQRQRNLEAARTLYIRAQREVLMPSEAGSGAATA